MDASVASQRKPWQSRPSAAACFDRLAMRTYLSLFVLATVALPAAAAVDVAPAPSSARSTASIYQQRTADGRLLLTDRPSPTAVIERTWAMEREEPAAAQQRAAEMRERADAVSERVQRRIEAQERLVAEVGLERMRLARLDREREIELERDAAIGVPVLIGGPFGRRGFSPHRRPGFEHRRPGFEPGHGPRHRHGQRGPGFRGSTGRGSR